MPAGQAAAAGPISATVDEVDAGEYSPQFLEDPLPALIQIQPYGVSLAAIANGDDDMYLRGFASAVRKFDHPVIIGFAREMNGTRYSWSRRHVPAAEWVAAWRQVVEVFRNERAEKVLFWGAGALQELLVRTVASAPDGTAPIDAVAAALEAAGPVFAERRGYARRRQAVSAKASLRPQGVRSTA